MTLLFEVIVTGKAESVYEVEAKDAAEAQANWATQGLLISTEIDDTVVESVAFVSDIGEAEADDSWYDSATD